MRRLLLLGGVLVGSLAIPMVALLALLGVASTAIACPAGPGGPLAGNAPVPLIARGWVAITHAVCPVLPESFIAAVMAQESGFRPDAYADDKNGGTWGLFQVNASIWLNAYGAPWSADLNGNGVWDVKEPQIHAAVGGKYLCGRLAGVRRIRAQHPDWASTRELSELDGLVIAHNAGEGRLRDYPAIPTITAQFIVNVRRRMAEWTADQLSTLSPLPSPSGPSSSLPASGAADPSCPAPALPAATPTGG